MILTDKEFKGLLRVLQRSHNDHEVFQAIFKKCIGQRWVPGGNYQSTTEEKTNTAESSGQGAA